MKKLTSEINHLRKCLKNRQIEQGPLKQRKNPDQVNLPTDLSTHLVDAFSLVTKPLPLQGVTES